MGHRLFGNSVYNGSRWPEPACNYEEIILLLFVQFYKDPCRDGVAAYQIHSQIGSS